MQFSATFQARCARDQQQSRGDDSEAYPPRGTLTVRCKALDGDGYGHDRHRADVHHSTDEEKHHQAAAAVAAIKAQAEAVSPGRAGASHGCRAVLMFAAAAGEVTRLPRGELERADDQDDHSDGDRYGARHCRNSHLDLRQRDAQRERDQAKEGPDEEVTRTNKTRQQAEARVRLS